MDITLKRIPEAVYRTIKREAKKRGRSLNAEILRTLEAEAAELERRRRLADLRTDLDRFASALPPMEDSAALIRQDRDR